jgi:hypothetical protein
MNASVGTVRLALRRGSGRLARHLARWSGFELVPIDRPGPEPDTEVIPRGLSQRFTTEEYEVLPKGRYDVVERNYYSPMPNLELLPEDIWERRSALRGVELGVDAAVGFLEDELAPFVAEFEAPRTDPGQPGVFYLQNENYESVDAELLYAILRARKPQRIIELGSGFTTLLIGEAVRRNAADGVEAEHLAYDPFPRAAILGEQPPPPTRFEPISATDVPLETFGELQAGDVLFVDTTHTVKLGSDVNYIVLDVLPTLAPGVIVHFHDVFLPWEYPKVWFESMGYYWAEQYLLQAFLSFNDAFEVLMPAHAVTREHPDRVAGVVPSFSPGVRPAAIWIVRR